MLTPHTTFEEADSSVFDGSVFSTFGDFDVLDYAATPQVSPSAIINDVDSVIESEQEEKLEPKSPEVLEHRNCLSVPRHRRDSHVRAEKKRRNKIQDQLRSLHVAIPTLQPLKSFQKLSELDTVLEAGNYTRSLCKHQAERLSELGQLRREKEKLKKEFENFQNTLPTAGIKKEKKKITLTDRYTSYRSEMICKEWKYVIFDRLVGASLLKTYVQQTGNEKSPSGYIKTLMKWTESELCLTSLRPVVISGVRDIATNTNFLAKPELLRQEINQCPLYQKPTSTAETEQKTPCTVTETERNTEFEERQRTKIRLISATVTSTSGSKSSFGEEGMPKLQVIPKQTEMDTKEEQSTESAFVSQTITINSSDEEEVQIIGLANFKPSHSGKRKERDTKTTTVLDTGNVIPMFSTFDSLASSDPNLDIRGESMFLGNMTTTTGVPGSSGSIDRQTFVINVTASPDTSREKT